MDSLFFLKGETAWTREVIDQISTGGSPDRQRTDVFLFFFSFFILFFFSKSIIIVIIIIQGS